MVKVQGYAGLIIAGMALALQPATAIAQTVSAQSQSDGRCMAAMLAMSEKSRGEGKAGFESGMMFFMGKIVGRAGKAGVSSALGASAASVTKANAPAIAERCAAEIDAVSAAM